MAIQRSQNRLHQILIHFHAEDDFFHRLDFLLFYLGLNSENILALLTYFLHLITFILLLFCFPVKGGELILLLEFEGNLLVRRDLLVVYKFEYFFLDFLIQDHVVLQVCELVVEFVVYGTLRLLMDLLDEFFFHFQHSLLFFLSFLILAEDLHVRGHVGSDCS